MLIEMTEEEAKRFGLLVCVSCGHPENNHFDFDNKPCAHCPKTKCLGYVPEARVGRIVPEGSSMDEAVEKAEKVLEDIGLGKPPHIWCTYDRKYNKLQAHENKIAAFKEHRRDPQLIDMFEYAATSEVNVNWKNRHHHAVRERQMYHLRWIEADNKYERLRVMFLECWHCKAALEEPTEPAHCMDCGVTDEEHIDWEEWKNKTTPRVKNLERHPKWVTVAYLWDRREQYKSSSGTYAAFDELIAHFAAGDHLKAYRHGELDDLKKNALNCIKKADT